MMKEKKFFLLKMLAKRLQNLVGEMIGNLTGNKITQSERNDDHE